MADNKTGGGPGDGGQPTLTEYKKSQARVRELVEKRRMLDRKLNQVEEGLVQKEAAYLESTPSGNIITGFDNYMKGISGAAAQRRKTGPMDQNRVFSRSSISYRPNTDSSTPGSTPVSHAPTPTASAKDSATPTSGSATKNSKKKKQKDQQENEESEIDVQTTKKRTNMGARK